MLKQIRSAYRRRRWMQQATSAIRAKEGVATRAWPVAPDMTGADLHAIAERVHPWLTEQVARTATPYGLSQVWIALALRDERTGQVPWRQNLPMFGRHEAQAALTTATTAIAMVPLAAHPSATRLELYLISLGDLVNAMADAADHT